MNNFNLIGKIQGVITNVISTVKENFSEDNIAALFDFSAKSDFSVGDIETLNNEFLQYQAKIQEDAKRKEKDNKQNEEINRITQNRDNLIKNANFPSELKEEMIDLYDKLSQSANMEESEAIIAQIDAKLQEAKANGSYNEELKGINKDIQSSALELALQKQIKQLQEDIKKTTSQEDKNLLQEKIAQLEYNTQVKNIELSKDAILESSSDLNDTQKNELNDLYTKLSKATNDGERDAINAQIEKYCTEEGISEDNKTLTELKKNAIISNMYTKASILNEEKMKTTSASDKATIQAKINEELANGEINLLGNNIMNKIKETNISNNAKEELIDIINNFKNGNSFYDKDSILAKINLEIEKANFFLENKDYSNIKDLLTRLNNKKTIKELYYQLANSSDKESNKAIKTQIKNLEEYNNQLIKK